MLQINKNKKFGLTFKISILLTLLMLVTLFYYFPYFESLFNKNKNIPFLKIIISEIPSTVQKSINSKGEKYFSTNIQTTDEELSPSEEETKIDSVSSISFRQFSDSLKSSYFDSDLLGEKIEKDQIVSYGQYRDMIKNMRPELDKQISPYELPDNIQAETNRKMGRDAQYLMFPQINLVEVFSKITSNDANKEISLEGILFCEKYLDILDTLWIKSPLKATEIYHKKRVRKNNTMFTLRNALNALIESGVVLSDKDTYGEVIYKPAINLKNMLAIINDYVTKSSLQKGGIYRRLTSIQNHIILNHEIY